MRYDLAIEDWKEIREEYIQKLPYTSGERFIETRTSIAMCDKFIAFLERMEEQDNEQ